jgi:hypothetical protein
MRVFSIIVILFVSLVVCSCASGDPKISSDRQLTPTPATASAESSHSSATTEASDRPTSATEKLLLARHIQFFQGGDGYEPECGIGQDTPPQFKKDVAVWVNNMSGPKGYPDHTVLCLRGFASSAPIEILVTAGNFSARTHIRPITVAPQEETAFGYEEEPSTTLFTDGTELRVYTKGYGDTPIGGPPNVLASEMWRFFPPEAARNAIAEHGSFTITASQNDRTASLKQSVQIPDTPSYRLLFSMEGGSGLALVGFPAGATVPIGHYRNDSDSSGATLVRQIGSVRVPISRQAAFTLPPNLLDAEDNGDYAVLPPIADQADWQSFKKWPSYPGQISPGDRGERVKSWQIILIEAEVIGESPENHDGVYGPATQTAVEQYLSNRQHHNPDGDGKLGRGFYDLLTIPATR